MALGYGSLKIGGNNSDLNGGLPKTWSDYTDNLKIGQNVAQLPPKVLKKAQNFKPGLLKNQISQGLQGLQMGQDLFPGVTTKVAKKLGISEDEVKRNAKEIHDASINK